MNLKYMNDHQIHKANEILNRDAIYFKKKKISLYVHYWGGETSLKSNIPHKHSFFEVCYVVSGKGIYMERGKKYALSDRTLFISLPHVTHQIISHGKLHLIFFAFEPIMSESDEEGKRIAGLLKDMPTILFKLNEENALEKLWNSLLLLANEPNEMMGDILNDLGFSLIYTAIWLFLKKNKKIRSNVRTVDNSETLLYSAKLYIRDNISQPLRLKDVADNLHISSRHLSRLFAEELGITYSEYVRKERIRHAIHLMNTTTLPIKEIASKTGFSTVHYFTTVFKEMTGMTPGQFKKNIISEDVLLNDTMF